MGGSTSTLIGTSIVANTSRKACSSSLNKQVVSFCGYSVGTLLSWLSHLTERRRVPAPRPGVHVLERPGRGRIRLDILACTSREQPCSDTGHQRPGRLWSSHRWHLTRLPAPLLPHLPRSKSLRTAWRPSVDSVEQTGCSMDLAAAQLAGSAADDACRHLTKQNKILYGALTAARRTQAFSLRFTPHGWPTR